MSNTVKAVPAGYHTITTMLVQDDSRKAIAWYKQALGAQEVFVSADPSGRVMHAEIRIGDSNVMLHDVMDKEKPLKEFGGSPANMWLYVDDCDALFNRAVAAGAKVVMPMTDMFWGDRFGVVTDPFGYAWAIATHKQDLSPAQIEEAAKQAYASKDCR